MTRRVRPQRIREKAMKTKTGGHGIGGAGLCLCMSVVMGSLMSLAMSLAVTGSASAQEAGGSPEAATPLASEIGHSTRDWLDLQRSGAQAAPPLTMLGDEAGLAYQRYMESFKAKIPVSFGSSVGGSGNLLRVDYTNMGASQ
jgi:hypothetical protein